MNPHIVERIKVLRVENGIKIALWLMRRGLPKEDLHDNKKVLPASVWKKLGYVPIDEREGIVCTYIEESGLEYKAYTYHRSNMRLLTISEERLNAKRSVDA